MGKIFFRPHKYEIISGDKYKVGDGQIQSRGANPLRWLGQIWYQRVWPAGVDYTAPSVNSQQGEKAVNPGENGIQNDPSENDPSEKDPSEKDPSESENSLKTWIGDGRISLLSKVTHMSCENGLHIQNLSIKPTNQVLSLWDTLSRVILTHLEASDDDLVSVKSFKVKEEHLKFLTTAIPSPSGPP